MSPGCRSFDPATLLEAYSLRLALLIGIAPRRTSSYQRHSQFGAGAGVRGRQDVLHLPVFEHRPNFGGLDPKIPVVYDRFGLCILEELFT